MQRIPSLFLVMSVALVGCQATGDLVPQRANKPAKTQLLSNMSVSADNFIGTLSVTHFDYVNGQLLVDGVFTGTANGTAVTQVINDVPATLGDSNTPTTATSFELAPAATCDVLFLDLGPINLDLLGLVVNMSPIDLNIDAVSGPGNLLGNLLCAVTGLLYGGPLASITRLLDNINRILDGIG